MQETPAKRARQVRVSCVAKSAGVRRVAAPRLTAQTINGMPVCCPSHNTGVRGVGAGVQLQEPFAQCFLFLCRLTALCPEGVEPPTRHATSRSCARLPIGCYRVCLQEDGHPDFDVSKLQQLAEACAANARSAPNSPAQQMLTPGPRMDPAGHAPGAGTTGPGAQGVLPTAAQHIAGTPAAEGPQPCMEADVAAGCPRRAPSSPSRQGRPVAEREQPELVTGQESDPPSVKDTADRAARLVPEAPQLQPPDTVTRPPPTETARGPALDPGALAALRTLEGYLHKQQGVLEQGRSQVLALRTEREGLRMQLEQQSRVRADAEEEARKLREELRSYRAAAEAQARAELEQQQAAAAAAARRAAEVQSQRDGEHEQLRGQYKELQGRHQEVCDKHLQLLARYEELLGDRGALQQQVTALQGRLTAAEQRAVAAERRAMEASAGMRTAAA